MYSTGHVELICEPMYEFDCQCRYKLKKTFSRCLTNVNSEFCNFVVCLVQLKHSQSSACMAVSGE